MTPLAAITAACALLGLLAIVYRPQYAVVLVFVMYPLEQLIQSYFPWFLYNPRVFNVVVLAMTAMAFFSRLTKSEPVARGYLNAVTVSVWLLYALVWVSLLYSPSRAHAFDIMVAGIPYYFFMLVVLPLLISDTESFRRILFGLMIAGLTICILIYLNPATSFYGTRMSIEFDPFGNQRRGNPLAVADLGSVISVVAILYRPQRASPLLLALRIAVVMIGLGLAVSTGSRGQVLAAVGAALVLFPFSRGLANARQLFTVSLALLLMVMVIRTVFSAFISDHNEQRWGVEAMSASMDDRINMARSLLGLWLSTPFAWPMGLGAGAMNAIDPTQLYVHNMVVEVLCEEGLLGITLLGIAVWFTIDAARKLMVLKRDEPELRAAAATLAALALYHFLCGLKQGTFIGAPGVFLCWFLLSKIHRTEQMRAEEMAAWEAEQAEIEAQEEAGSPDPWEEASDDAELKSPRRPVPAVAHRAT